MSRQIPVSREALTEKPCMPILSADWLVDWFFERFVYILTFTEWRIVWKRRLRVRSIEKDGDTKCTYATIFGITETDIQVITLNASRRFHPDDDAVLETLVHELAHVLFGGESGDEEGMIPHRAIAELEKIVIHFTPQRRAYLLSFVPPRPRTRKRCTRSTLERGA